MSLPRAFTALSGATAVSMAAQLVRGKLAALFLGPAGVGIFNQLSVMWNLFQLGGQLGSFNGIVQHGAEALAADDRVALRRLVATSTLLLGIVACALAACGVIFAPALSNLLLHDGGRHADLVALILVGVPIGVSAQIYRALLSSARAVTQLVRTQIFSDVGAAVIFAALVWPLGLTGAILGFMATHLLLFIAGAWSVRRTLGGKVLNPAVRDFRWSVVRSNVGFGASGLLLIGLGNFAVLVIGRLLIEHWGAAANGIFGNAWRIASVYLGSVTTTTIGYYLPTLTRCPDDASMGREVNTTLRFYFLILPPVMAGIMALGELVVWLILSRAFLPAATLLLLLVPAEFVRIIGDTVIAQFMARRRMWGFSILYVLQFAILIVAALLLVPTRGALGAAIAYATAMSVGALLMLIACNRTFSLALEGSTVRTGIRAVALMSGVGLTCVWFPLGVARLAICLLLGLAWLGITLREDFARQQLGKLWSSVPLSRASASPMAD